ncbi:MAG: YbjQ family protein [Methylovirgula sp.]
MHKTHSFTKPTPSPLYNKNGPGAWIGQKGEGLMIVATSNEVAGYRIVRHLGLVRGITVRSRSVIGNFVGGIQSIFGGKLGAYVHLAETARQEAFDHMCEHARQGGANAVICMRYDANEIMDGITEVLAYGTAVWVEPV